MAESTQRPDVRLEIDGKLYGGWKDISITRSLEQCAGTFELSVTDRWPQQEQSRQIPPGGSCRVLVNHTPVITGYVDDVDVAYDAVGHTYRATGRDKTADLVDCCPPSTQLKGAGLVDLARRWAALFGIEVVVAVSGNLAKVPNFKSDEGETCFEMLERLARANAVMLTTDGQGRLVITRAGTVKASVGLKLGDNLLKFGMSSSMKDRFSTITVKGQSGGSESWNGKVNAQAGGSATDANVPRYRPLTLVAEQEEYGSATTRARHEVAIRYGKGHKATATVNGWFAGAALWVPNTLVDILGNGNKVMATWLITDAHYQLSDSSGWITDLTLSPKEAYDLIPEAPKGKKGKGKDAGTWADMGAK
ncbi:phage baseplate assembly protein [Desulfovibrio sp.]|uniref:phage baseplate assembly protein n=1 Tax=Desulfovibrio sp. TaxID=885 RepID=UPI003D0E423A